MILEIHSDNQLLQVRPLLQLPQHVLERLIAVNFSLFFEIRHIIDEPSSFVVGLES
jgi:hypothetical protein